MKINPYLSFNGNCAEAFAFYEKALGGKMVYKSTYGETPMAKQMPQEMHGKIIHARLDVGGEILMGCDAGDRYSKPQGIQITINVKTPAEAESLFKGLSEGATVTMPIQETFWATRFGMLIDQFGIPWMINCEKIQS